MNGTNAAFAAARSTPEDVPAADEAPALDVGAAADRPTALDVGAAADDVPALDAVPVLDAELQAASDTIATLDTHAATHRDAERRRERILELRGPSCDRVGEPAIPGPSDLSRGTLPHCRSPKSAVTTTLLLALRNDGCHKL